MNMYMKNKNKNTGKIYMSSDAIQAFELAVKCTGRISLSLE